MKNRLFRFGVAVLLLAAQIAVGGICPPVDWAKAQKVQRGIRLVKMELRSPRLIRAAVMRIDLKTPGLTLTTTGRDRDWGKIMPDRPGIRIATRRITSAEFMKNARRPRNGKPGVDMIAVFNAAPWTPWESPFTHKYGMPLGLNISGGVVVSDNHPELPALIEWKRGGIELLPAVDRRLVPKIKEAASGFCFILHRGRVLPNEGYSAGLHPRLGCGLSADRRYLFIVAVDGRQKNWSLGATGSETAEILLAAGAFDAINFDGGGSTSLLYWDAKTRKPVATNRHTSGGYMRPVGSNVGIVLRP